jgi:fumarate reductase subunit D
MARSRSEPLLWSFFGLGGVLAAVFLPIHLALIGIVVPAGLADDALGYDRMRGLADNWLFRIYCLVLFAVAFFHAAHRMRFTVIDNGGHSVAGLVTAVFYGAAGLVALAAAYVVLLVL